MRKRQLLSLILVSGMVLSDALVVTSAVQATTHAEQVTDHQTQPREAWLTKNLSQDAPLVAESDLVTKSPETTDAVVAGEHTPKATNDTNLKSSTVTEQPVTKASTKDAAHLAEDANLSEQAEEETLDEASELEQVPSEDLTAITTDSSLWSAPLGDDLSPLGLDIRPSVTNTYVEHWSGQDAYTHHLLSKRFGISAEQLDGYLQSTGIAYDSSRFNGQTLLKWEKESGLDVRAIVAIAIAESSLGTAGVAKDNQANAFGYGAFDSNPDNAKQFKDEDAIKALTKVTIMKQQNHSFKRQDDKAQLLAKGQLDVAKDGGVYFTDTSGSGQRRAKIMEDLDRFIDQHGGTPKAPALSQNLSSGLMTAIVPEGFKLDTPINPTNYISASYPWGQCTWYVYNRAKELGVSFSPFMGNGGDWRLQLGYETRHEPKKGAALSFAPGQAGADATYGHVAFVEDVREDGSILISESNVTGLGKVSFRTFSAKEAKQLTYVIGH